MTQEPVKIQVNAQLQELGVNGTSIGFNTLTMESDRFICVREQLQSGNQVVIVDLENGNEIMRRPITADSIIMHPTKKVMALKFFDHEQAQTTLQVFNLDNKTKLASHSLGGEVKFWKWINAETIALIAGDAVYHWSIVNEAQPKPVFRVDGSLRNCQIINYRVSADQKWMALNGLYAGESPYPNVRSVRGTIQLFSTERNISQVLPGHVASFAEVNLDDGMPPVNVFVYASGSQDGSKIEIIGLGLQGGNPRFTKKTNSISFESADYPVAIQISPKFGVLFLITHMGFLSVYDLESGSQFYTNKLTDQSVFRATDHQASSGAMCVDKRGTVLSVSLNEDTITQYLVRCGNADLALKVAYRGSLPGAEDLCSAQFNQLLSAGEYNKAAIAAAKSPKGILRTPQTIDRLKTLPPSAGHSLSPILQYFGTLLETDRLNKHESMALSEPILSQNKKDLFGKWLKEDKLECTEELGDYVKRYDSVLALSVYLRANAPSKVVQCFAENRQYDKIAAYAKTVGYNPDYQPLLYNVARADPDNVIRFATELVNNELIRPEKVVDVFQSQSMIQQATSFLLDYLKENREQDAALQTRVLEMNLNHAPQVADAVLATGMLSHYDRVLIGSLCEKTGLYQRALEHFTDIHDIKRVIPHSATIPADWLVNYFGTLSADQTLECLQEMLTNNFRQNLQVVVQVAIKYSEQIEPHNLVKLFEHFKSSEGLYYYLGSIVNVSQDPLVHFKYIQAACRTGNVREVERICRESDYYDAEKVKNFLKEAKLSDQLPLIIVCDRFGFVHDLVLYLYHNDLQKFIEVYVQKVNPQRTPEVVGALLDVGCNEGVIETLLMSVKGDVSVAKLCEEAEERNRLKLLLPWLNMHANEGSTDTEVYNALAKIYIDTNNNPEPFLKENEYYDKRKIGKYCEPRDHYLAYICYEKGQCDYELIHVTTENSMFKHQARYLVSRRDPDVWSHVLHENNEHRQELLDQISQTAIPECTDPDYVSKTVKAYMTAGLPDKLIELLEAILLKDSAFSDNGTLQNLLFYTAIKTDPDRVADYVTQLHHFEWKEVAEACLGEGLYDEALAIYQKFEQHVKAVEVLVDRIEDLDRACEFAESCDKAPVWSILAKAQLDKMHIKEAVNAYIRANDMNNYKDVTRYATESLKYEELVRYLQVAHTQLRETYIDTELLFAYAKTERLADLEGALATCKLANVEQVGDRCADHHLFEAAKILYSSISNHAKLATTLVHLQDYHSAVECARKANKKSVWKEVNAVCVEQREFRLAQICGLHVVVQADEMDNLVKRYEDRGYFAEIVQLLEAGLGLERAHRNMFTRLAVLYAHHQPEKLMEHLQHNIKQITIPKVIRTCDEARLWRELVFLYLNYDEYDNAARTIIAHGPDAWEHASFNEIIGKVQNVELCYRSLHFYLDEHPMQLNDLLAKLTPRIKDGRMKIDRVVDIFNKSDNIPLIKPYLISIQSVNRKSVNMALNALYIEEEDYDALRDSIDNHNAIDIHVLIGELKDHELIEFRRIAARLYAKDGKWKSSISLSKEDQLFTDAMMTAAQSGDRDEAEALLKYFVEVGKRECFAAMLYLCYDLMRPDRVIELAWSKELRDFAMPYMINFMAEQRNRIGALDTNVRDLKDKQKSRENADSQHADALPPMMHHLMLPAPTGPSPFQ